MGWQPIETAPKNGTVICARRRHEGVIVWEGKAVWRSVSFPAADLATKMRAAAEMPIGAKFVAGYATTGWMYPDIDKRVPEPTEWSPVEQSDAVLQPRQDFAGLKPPFNLVATVPDGVRIVSMITFQDQLLIATENAIYRKVGDEFEPVPVKLAAGDAEAAPDKGD